MLASTKVQVIKTGETLRTLTLPDRDISFDEKAAVTYVDTQDATKITGISTSVNNCIVVFDSTTGKLVKQAGGGNALIDDTGNVTLAKRINLPNTTALDTDAGVFYKNGVPSIHNFNYGNNGTVTTNGNNLFLNGSGNFTMGATATSSIQASNNIAFGKNSFSSNETGYNNVAIAPSTLRDNTTGFGNFAACLNSMYHNISGNNNFSVGVNSFFELLSGNSNIAIGTNAGRYIIGNNPLTQANKCIYIGQATQASINNPTNEIVIGLLSTGKGSNTVRLGSSVTLNTYFEGVLNSLDTYNNTSSTGSTVVIDAAGAFYRSTSSSKYKENIDYTGVDGSLLYQLKPCSFNGKRINNTDFSLEIPSDKTIITIDDDGQVTHDDTNGLAVIESTNGKAELASLYSIRWIQGDYIIVDLLSVSFLGNGNIYSGLINSNNGIFIEHDNDIISVAYSVNNNKISEPQNSWNGDDVLWVVWSDKNNFRIKMGENGSNDLVFQVKNNLDEWKTIHTFTIPNEIVAQVGSTSLPIVTKTNGDATATISGWAANDISPIESIGFIAEDVEQVEPRLVQFADGVPESLHYENATALITAALKDLKTQVDGIQTQINTLHPA